MRKEELIAELDAEILNLCVTFPKNNFSGTADSVEIPRFFQMFLDALKKQTEIFENRVKNSLCPYCNDPIPVELKNKKGRGRKPIFCCESDRKNYYSTGKKQNDNEADFKNLLHRYQSIIQYFLTKIELPENERAFIKKTVVMVFRNGKYIERSPLTVSERLKIKKNEFDIDTSDTFEFFSDSFELDEEEILEYETFYPINSTPSLSRQAELLDSELNKFLRVHLSIFDYALKTVTAKKSKEILRDLLLVKKIVCAEIDRRETEKKDEDNSPGAKTSNIDRNAKEQNGNKRKSELLTELDCGNCGECPECKKRELNYSAWLANERIKDRLRAG